MQGSIRYSVLGCGASSLCVSVYQTTTSSMLCWFIISLSFPLEAVVALSLCVVIVVHVFLLFSFIIEIVSSSSSRQNYHLLFIIIFITFCFYYYYFILTFYYNFLFFFLSFYFFFPPTTTTTIYYYYSFLVAGYVCVATCRWGLVPAPSPPFDERSAVDNLNYFIRKHDHRHVWTIGIHSVQWHPWQHNCCSTRTNKRSNESKRRPPTSR